MSPRARGQCRGEGLTQLMPETARAMGVPAGRELHPEGTSVGASVSGPDATPVWRRFKALRPIMRGRAVVDTTRCPPARCHFCPGYLAQKIRERNVGGAAGAVGAFLVILWLAPNAWKKSATIAKETLVTSSSVAPTCAST